MPDSSQEEFSFDFEKLGNSSKNSKEIMNKYLLKDIKKHSFEEDGQEKHFDVYEEMIQSFEYDLNNDGIKEVIGVYPFQPYCGFETCRLFVLQKQKDGDEYKDICDFSVMGIPFKVGILKSVNFGYKQIQVYGRGRQFVYSKLKYVVY